MRVRPQLYVSTRLYLSTGILTDLIGEHIEYSKEKPLNREAPVKDVVSR